MTGNTGWMRVASSALLGLSTVALLLGVLLTPNVVVAKDEIGGVATMISICGGCAGTCPNKPKPCSGGQPTCLNTGTSQSCNGCGCAEKPSDPAHCQCQL